MLRPASTLLVLATLASCSLTGAKKESADGASAAAPAPADLPAWVDAPNFRILDEDVAGSGPPTAQAIAGLRARGYGMVIDLRTAEEPGFAGERAAVEAAGLRYVHIPIAGLGFDLTDAAALRAALDDAPAGKVLLHCRSGARASTLWGLADGMERGLTPEQAAAAAQRGNPSVSDGAAARIDAELTHALRQTAKD